MGAVADGGYYRKQLGCQSSVFAWSHRARFDAGLRLVGSVPGKLLDYGCGDGTLPALASGRISEGWGADIAANQVADCQTRLAGFANLRFCPVAAPADPALHGTFDVITCMEALEYCTASVVEIVLAALARLVRPGGQVVISVPIEIGPTFQTKLVICMIAAWGGLSDYRYHESYPLRDAAKMLFALKATTVERAAVDGPDAPSHSH